MPQASGALAPGQPPAGETAKAAAGKGIMQAIFGRRSVPSLIAVGPHFPLMTVLASSC